MASEVSVTARIGPFGFELCCLNSRESVGLTERTGKSSLATREQSVISHASVSMPQAPPHYYSEYLSDIATLS